MAKPALDIPGLRCGQPPLRDPRRADQVPPRPVPRAPSTTSTCGAAPRSWSRARSASTSPTRPSRWSPGPGAQEEYFRKGNPEGKSRREIFGEPMRSIPAFREPAARLAADGRAGHRPRPDVPHAGQPGRGADAGRPRADPRRHPRPQPVDPRDVAVRLRGPHLRHAGHHPAHRGAGHRGARVGGASGAPGWC